MTDKVLAEVLMAYADDLNNKGMVERETYLSQVPDQRDELEALLRLTERIKQALVPVRPLPTFVKNLTRQWATADRGKTARTARGHRREIFIGAAAVGSALSVIGLVTYLIRSRAQIKTQVASTG